MGKILLSIIIIIVILTIALFVLHFNNSISLYQLSLILTSFIFFVFAILGIIFSVFPRTLKDLTVSVKSRLGWKPVSDNFYQSLLIYRISAVLLTAISIYSIYSIINLIDF
jgi:hypothetical protein